MEAASEEVSEARSAGHSVDPSAALAEDSADVASVALVPEVLVDLDSADSVAALVVDSAVSDRVALEASASTGLTASAELRVHQVPREHQARPEPQALQEHRELLVLKVLLAQLVLKVPPAQLALLDSQSSSTRQVILALGADSSVHLAAQADHSRVGNWSQPAYRAGYLFLETTNDAH